MRRLVTVLAVLATALTIILAVTIPAGAADDCDIAATITDGILTVTRDSDSVLVTVNNVPIEDRYFHDGIGFVMPVEGFPVLTLATDMCVLTLPTVAVPDYAPPPYTGGEAAVSELDAPDLSSRYVPTPPSRVLPTR